jgi:hypothetical protein
MSGCDNSAPVDLDKIEYIGLEKDTLVFSGDASSAIIKTDVWGWGIGAFRSTNTFYPEDSLSTLKAKTTKKILTEYDLRGFLNWNETLSYEWIEASKKEKALQVSVTENTSGTPRSLFIYLSGGGLVEGEFLFVIQHPKGVQKE